MLLIVGKLLPQPTLYKEAFKRGSSPEKILSSLTDPHVVPKLYSMTYFLFRIKLRHTHLDFISILLWHFYSLTALIYVHFHYAYVHSGKYENTDVFYEIRSHRSVEHHHM